MLPYLIVYFLCHYKYMGWIWFWSIGVPWYFFSLFIDFKWGRLVPLRNQTKPLFVPGQPYYTALSDECDYQDHGNCLGIFPADPKIHRIPDDPRVRARDKILCSCKCHVNNPRG